jgi:uncharacterized membrane protein YqjE
MTTSSAPSDESSIGELLGDVTRDLSLLVRQELELAKVELRESAVRAGRGAGELTGAGVAALLGLIFVSVAVWWAIGDGIGRGWAALIVGAFYFLVGAALAMVGRKELKSVSGLPQTTETVQRIPNAMKGNEDAS